jgi:hypothetical protein
MKNKPKKAAVAKESIEDLEMAVKAKKKAESDARVQACAREIEDVLKKYNCISVPVVTIIPGQAPEGGIKIVAK